MSKQSFLNFLKFEKRYSIHTINAYSHEIDTYVSFLESQSLALEHATFRDVRAYLSQLKENGRQATSINRSISSLRSYYKFLLREGLVAASPMVLIHALKTGKKLPVVIEQDKMVHLLDEGHTRPNDFEHARDFVVLELLFGTGIRLSELLNIKERDIDTYNRRVLILGKRNKERLVPIHQTLMEEITQYLKLKYSQEFKNNSSHLIVTNVGKQAYPKLIYRIVQHYLAQITSQKKRSPHVLRHSFASTLLNNGADLNAIKELLGHAGLAATQVYTHNSVERLKTVYKQAHPKA
ncbi:tyrosine-type recombinase/integrase [Sphingobacterium shayense]|uniref:tyrosine-type recombinase/integrase n=1 Tax=Sphingobacterium shayense TaxID=626343 RepID=UPI00155290DD|nr:tyrosine-type recombinase/integrase [Sphingobacterium shayense]NQD70138.1 tyrosine-type recombinase/integrase [Sphingobacterium shayense]